MKEDKKYSENIWGSIPREEYQKRIDQCDTKRRVLQDDYFNTLQKFVDVRIDTIINPEKPTNDESMDRARDELYYVRKMKEIQTQICHQLNYGRQLQIDLSKSALEDAFSPHLKSMLIGMYEKQIEELKEENER